MGSLSELPQQFLSSLTTTLAPKILSSVVNSSQIQDHHETATSEQYVNNSIAVNLMNSSQQLQGLSHQPLHQDTPLEAQLSQQQQQQQHQQLAHASVFTDPVSQTKLIVSVVLFFITLMCGYLPVKCILNQNYIQYAMFAGGGVLMATAFCHLIPEAHDNYRLLMVQPPHGHHHTHQHNHQLDHQLPASSLINDTISETSANLIAAATNTTDGQHDDLNLVTNPSGSTIGSDLNIPYLEITLCCGFFFMYLVEVLMVRFINNHTHEHPCDTSLGQLVIGVSPDSGRPDLYNGLEADYASSSNAASTGAINIVSESPSPGRATEFYKFIRGLLIVSAFGAHSIFDGVAIGSQETVEKVWTIFLAISCHKLIIAAVVGLELYAATLESRLWTLVHLGVFSVMSPIGIILVVVAQSSFNLDANSQAMILLQSFATGTLLYIVFIEILQPKEGQSYEKNKIGKSFSLIGGFALMLLVMTLIGEG